MNYNIKEVSSRLKATREYLDISPEFMAERTSTTVEEYTSLENGEQDFSLSFLNACAEALGIEMIELLTGVEPKLQTYSLVRKDQGLPIERRIGFTYQHIAYLFKNKNIEPLIVEAPYSEEEQNKPIHLSVHDGQEMDYILSGQLKFIINDHEEILSEGDCIYYNSKNPHGMIAYGGADCKFLAVLI
ncbi:MAG: XRE family transcriptional regulator [Firmicutes bacterium]|nr:XRE family transcriptional regulator [[Eubacterium] siraeum]MCM1487848.1 XRE family transcriptional regulator [Bacillota bacterium]